MNTPDTPTPYAPYLPPDGSGSPLSEAPTKVRYGVLAFLCALTFILYLDRVCLGQATTSIMEELSLTEDHMALVNVAFMIPYALFEVPIGHWGDRFGS
ncbi:MAG: hypothetical protein ACRC1K_07360, partial [Planctomycetia bacterium]